VPLDYEVEDGMGVARVRLREGQARRLRQDELPALDRPLRFAVQRGGHPPIQADTIPALHSALQRAPKAEAQESQGYRDAGGRRGRGRRSGPHARRGGKPRGRPRR
jgi:ATP-dependent helicase HrpA